MVMRDFQERKKIERLLYSWPAVFAVFFLFLVLIWGIIRTSRTVVVLRNEVEELEENIAESEEKRQSFEKRLDDLETPSGIEVEARGRFNLKKEGEEVVLFIEEDGRPEKVGFASKLSSVWAAIKNFFKLRQ